MSFSPLLLFGLAMLIPLMVKMIMKRAQWSNRWVDVILIIMFAIGIMVVLISLFGGTAYHT